MMIVNDDYRVITKLETSLTDDARVIIYNHHMFIVQATGVTLTRKTAQLKVESSAQTTLRFSPLAFALSPT
jgi:hypothetical protein